MTQKHYLKRSNNLQLKGVPVLLLSEEGLLKWFPSTEGNKAETYSSIRSTATELTKLGLSFSSKKHHWFLAFQMPQIKTIHLRSRSIALGPSILRRDKEKWMVDWGRGWTRWSSWHVLRPNLWRERAFKQQMFNGFQRFITKQAKRAVTTLTSCQVFSHRENI